MKGYRTYTLYKLIMIGVKQKLNPYRLTKFCLIAVQTFDMLD